MRKIPRVLLSAGSSGSGKTLLTCGILQALKNRGMKAASFKCGPDYIDPMFHTQVIGTPSRNLDTFFTDSRRTLYLFGKNCQDCEIAVMEGVMGYYDGVGGVTEKASAYDLAQTTQTPAVLIVNAKGMSVSLAAYVKGFLEFRKDSCIRGVILNQISPMLYPRMKNLLEQELGIRVFGYVPVVKDCVIESRHLGLVLPEEIENLREKLLKLAAVLEETLEIEELLKLAASAPDLFIPEDLQEEDAAFGFRTEKKVRIGVARDEAFCFFYQDNFRLLEEMGAELVWFSPLHQSRLPENLDGLLLYGGYPELYGRELESNESMRNDIKKAIQGKMPCMAECGGFMYLHDSMEGINGDTYRMAGVIQGNVFHRKKLTRFGYVELEKKQGTGKILGQESFGSIPAHEFHYFDSENCGNSFKAQKPLSQRKWDCIHGSDSLLAGFPHLYYYANPRIPMAFLQCCEIYAKEKKTCVEEWL